jgi:hypothetical protein
MVNSGGRASWSCGAHDGGLFSKLRGSSSGDASTTRTKRCISVLWSGIDLAFTWGKLLRCRDEDDERRPVHGSVWRFPSSKYDNGNRRNGCS